MTTRPINTPLAYNERVFTHLECSTLAEFALSSSTFDQISPRPMSISLSSCPVNVAAITETDVVSNICSISWYRSSRHQPLHQIRIKTAGPQAQPFPSDAPSPKSEPQHLP